MSITTGISTQRNEQNGCNLTIRRHKQQGNKIPDCVINENNDAHCIQ